VTIMQHEARFRAGPPIKAARMKSGHFSNSVLLLVLLGEHVFWVEGSHLGSSPRCAPTRQLRLNIPENLCSGGAHCVRGVGRPSWETHSRTCEPATHENRHSAGEAPPGARFNSLFRRRFSLARHMKSPGQLPIVCSVQQQKTFVCHRIKTVARAPKRHD